AAGIFAGDPTPRAVARFKCRPIPHDHNRFAGRQHHGSERLESDQWIIELDFIGKSAVPGGELDSRVAEGSAGKKHVREDIDRYAGHAKDVRGQDESGISAAGSAIEV